MNAVEMYDELKTKNTDCVSIIRVIVTANYAQKRE